MCVTLILIFYFKWDDTTVTKWENAGYQYIFPFPLCLKAFYLEFVKILKGVTLVFTCLQYNYFENTVEKGEIARAMSPVSTVFSTLLENFLPILSN